MWKDTVNVEYAVGQCAGGHEFEVSERARERMSEQNIDVDVDVIVFDGTSL